jgi:Domain of unknown function (DUF4123)
MKPNYILLDAARTGLEVIYKANELCTERKRSLYLEKEFTMLQRVAPYLYEITGNKEFLAWFEKEGLGKSWGILLQTEWNFEATYDHFRRFLKVKTEDDKQLIFRFYDPRVLKLFLPTCDASQLKDFFGKVDCFFIEEERTKIMKEYCLTNKVLQIS